MVRELNPHELMMTSGGAACGCRRCREMGQLGDDIIDFFDGLLDGLNDGL